MSPSLYAYQVNLSLILLNPMVCQHKRKGLLINYYKTQYTLYLNNYFSTQKKIIMSKLSKKLLLSFKLSVYQHSTYQIGSEEDDLSSPLCFTISFKFYISLYHPLKLNMHIFRNIRVLFFTINKDF